LITLAAGRAAGAEAELTRERGYDDIAAVRLRYGAAVRSGSQADLGPGLSYSGLTPNDVAVEAWYFPSQYVGATLYGQREGFGLYGPEGLVTAGSLARLHVGPTARFAIWRVRLDAVAAYQFAQLPAFASSATPVLAAGQRHAVLLAARGLVDVGPFSAELRAEVPLSLSAQGPGGVAATSDGLGLAATVRVPLTTVDRLEVAALLDGSRVVDSLSWAPDAARPDSRTVSSQQVLRFGAALQARWLDVAPGPELPRFGGLLVSVVDRATGAAIAGAAVSLEAEGRSTVLSAAEGGRFSADGLAPGPVMARASASGYLPAETAAAVVAGVQGQLEVKLAKEPPKVGALSVKVLDKETGAPVVGAKLKVRDRDFVTGPSGVVAVPDLPPGPVQLKVTAAGFHPGQEVAAVVAAQSSVVTFVMVREAKRIPATIIGRVRSTEGGKPVVAELELPQAKIRTRAAADGTFTFEVVGGVYTVNISAPGYRSQSKSVTVKDGDQAIFNVDLHPK
jgi:hypothetical protein